MTRSAEPARTARSAPPLRIYTLGRFAIEQEGRPLPTGERVQHRPLELLGLLIAGGGREVPETWLAEALWPDADGDRAHGAFATTLHRLRKLLGHEALLFRDRRLSLSFERCWVDALALDALTRDGHPEQALTLYQGPFLAGEAEYASVVAARERLRALFLSRAEALGHRHEAAGRPVEAIGVYERALAAEPDAEPLWRGLMCCHRATGQPGAAVAAYHRFRRAAPGRGAGPPTPETEAMLQEALAERDALAPLPDQPSLAVLPFAGLGRVGRWKWLAAGFTRNLTTRLARVPRLTLIGWPAPGTSAGLPERIRETGRELGVRFVLLGTVLVTGERLRVTAQLLEAATERHLWAERYDRALTDAFAVQDEIVEAILTALQVQLTEGEQARTVWRGTHDLQAWELTLRAIEHFRHSSRENNGQVRRLGSEALELDPDYVMAQVVLGWSYVRDAARGWPPGSEEALRRAEALAGQALGLDPASGPAHVLLGHVRMKQRRHAEGRPLLLRAAELNPGGADTAVAVGVGLVYCGEPELALQEVRRAMRLTPFYPEAFLESLARCHYFSGRYAEALQALLRGSVPRQMLSGQVLIVASQAALGERKAARDRVRQMLQAEHGLNRAHCLRWLYPMRRAKDAARLDAHLRAAGCP